MKNLLFSVVMMIALGITAGRAMAQGTKTTPYKGGTYSYTLGGIEVNTTGYAVITYSGSDATIQNVEGQAGAYTGDPITVASGSVFELNFDIAYGAAAGNGIITVTVTDGATSGCFNSITWEIIPTAAPTLDLAITTNATTPYCQATTGTTNNVDAATGSTNTIIYSITPTTGAGTGYTYDFTLAVTPSAFGTYTIEKTSGTGTVSAAGVVAGANGIIEISATWITTTGLPPTDIVGTISASTLHLSSAEGGINITGTESTSTATVSVNSTPKIGTFY